MTINVFEFFDNCLNAIEIICAKDLIRNILKELLINIIIMPYTETDKIDENNNKNVITIKQHGKLTTRRFPNLQIANNTSILTPSLFPNVPPYISFAMHTQKFQSTIPEIRELLKFRVGDVSYRSEVLLHILANSDYCLAKDIKSSLGLWSTVIRNDLFAAIQSHQKINHIPGSLEICHKDSCWRKLRKNMIAYGKKEFGFMPETYILPNERKTLQKVWPKYRDRNTKWILKPPCGACGLGVRVINKWDEIPKGKLIVVQKYIERPYLINDCKFDLRIYVLVTSVNPLKIYLHKDGLVRFASVEYNNRDDKLGVRCMHLTNYSLNKHCSRYTKNVEIDGCCGHKWTLKTLWKCLSAKNVNIDGLWTAITKLIICTIISGQNTMHHMTRLHSKNRYNNFELFGFDILLDYECRPWLLEVNYSPHLHSDTKLDLHVKGPLVSAVLNTALFHLPPSTAKDWQNIISKRFKIEGTLCYDERLYSPHLSKSAIQKHKKFTEVATIKCRDDYLNEILKQLTPDDVRCLLTTEDELHKCSPLDRIFPTKTSYTYLAFADYPRYYDRLLDAWENRYADNRQKGIELLRKYCAQNFHLQEFGTQGKNETNNNE